MLKDTEIVALSKMLKAKVVKEALGKLDEGKHEVDIKVHVYGNLDIKDTERPSTTSIPLLKALALCLHYAGIQRENLLPTLEKAIQQSMKMGQDEIQKAFATEEDPTGLDFWIKMTKMEKRIKDEVIAKLPPTPIRNSNAKLVIKELSEEIIEETEEILKSA